MIEQKPSIEGGVSHSSKPRSSRTYPCERGATISFAPSAEFSDAKVLNVVMRSKGQTPDEMYFGKGNDIPNQLSDARTVARQARLAANCAVTCSKCAPTDCLVQIDNKPNETG